MVGRKRHVAVDTDGRLLMVNLTTADISDSAGAQTIVAAIRGHVFVSFLAPTLDKGNDPPVREKDFQPEWHPLLNDLDRLRKDTMVKSGKVITTRFHVTGRVESVFKALGIALPHSVTEQPRDALATGLLRNVALTCGMPRPSCRHSVALLRAVLNLGQNAANDPGQRVRLRRN